MVSTYQVTHTPTIRTMICTTQSQQVRARDDAKTKKVDATVQTSEDVDNLVENRRKRKRAMDDDGGESDYDSDKDYTTTSDDERTSIETDDVSITSTSKHRELRKKLASQWKQCYIEEDIEYYAKLEPEKQCHIDDLETRICKCNRTLVPLRFRVLESEMDIQLKALAISKIDQLACLDNSSSEYYKLTNWIENLCKIPIGKYASLPVSMSDGAERVSDFLQKAHTTLDEVVYGHKEAKDQVIRVLAKWISNPHSKGLVIGIEGVPGIGKTSLVKDGICQLLGLPFGFVTLGGISDGSYVVGHSYTYEGSRWGKVADMLMKVGCMNPVLYFDELDKISCTSHGEEIANILIHLTDVTQNDRFQDKYFVDLDLDLSRCLIIFSYNHAENINPILRDRMTVIKAHGYNTKDKVVIARDYMIPKLLVEYGMTEHDVKLSEDIIKYIISVTREEQGVRNLKRSLEDIISHINLNMLLKKPLITDGDIDVRPIVVTQKIVDTFVRQKDIDSALPPMMYT